MLSRSDGVAGRMTRSMVHHGTKRRQSSACAFGQCADVRAEPRHAAQRQIALQRREKNADDRRNEKLPEGELCHDTLAVPTATRGVAGATGSSDPADAPRTR